MHQWDCCFECLSIYFITFGMPSHVSIYRWVISCVCLICTVLFNFQNSPTPTNVSLHPFQRHGKCSSIWMLWSLLGWTFAGMRWFCWTDTQIFKWLRWPMEALVIHHGKGGPSHARSLALRYSFQTIPECHGILPHHSTTDRQTLLCLSLQPHTLGPSILLRNGSCWFIH